MRSAGEKAAATGAPDRVLDVLEKGEGWFAVHYPKLVAGLFLALCVIGFMHMRERSRQSDEERLYGETARLKGIAEQREFLGHHPDAKASAQLYLSVARGELQEGKYSEALGHARGFLQRFPEHPFTGLAHLLAGYAHEELGHAPEAIAAYELAAGSEGAWSYLAKQAATRLKANPGRG